MGDVLLEIISYGFYHIFDGLTSEEKIMHDVSLYIMIRPIL